LDVWLSADRLMLKYEYSNVYAVDCVVADAAAWVFQISNYLKRKLAAKELSRQLDITLMT